MGLPYFFSSVTIAEQVFTWSTDTNKWCCLSNTLSLQEGDGSIKVQPSLTDCRRYVESKYVQLLRAFLIPAQYQIETNGETKLYFCEDGPIDVLFACDGERNLKVPAIAFVRALNPQIKSDILANLGTLPE